MRGRSEKEGNNKGEAAGEHFRSERQQRIEDTDGLKIDLQAKQRRQGIDSR